MYSKGVVIKIYIGRITCNLNRQEMRMERYKQPPRDIMVNIRLNEEERTMLHYIAHREGLGISATVRLLIKRKYQRKGAKI